MDNNNVGKAVKERIIDLCNSRGITINRLSILCGITQSTLNNIVSGRNNSTTIATIKKICDGLDISLKEFFDSPLFDALDQEIL
ncbi:MAG: helix-turn-helix transcriptional regulator [Firmicutes bacterium]|nr:helix-turn-helix transcriptional regulator [Bacillota bacterium]